MKNLLNCLLRGVSLILGTVGVLATSANAATVTSGLSGTLTVQGNYSGYALPSNPNGQPTTPIGLIAVIGGGGCSTTAGSCTPSAVPLTLTGSITYDNITNAISALTLSQSGSVTAFLNGSSTPASTGKLTTEGSQFTWSNLAWILNGNQVNQTAGTATCVKTIGSGTCTSFSAPPVFGLINANTGDSPLDYDGVTTGFLVSGSLAVTPGLPNVIAWDGTNLAITGYSQFNGAGGNPVGNDYGVGNFSLTTVPVPGAFWLMGSGLMGLGSIARRRFA